MKFRLLLPALFAVLLCACGGNDPLDPKPDPGPYVPVDPNPPSVYKYGLRELGRANKLLIGAAFTYGEYAGDDSLKVVLARDFESVTFGNEMKHDGIVRSDGGYNFQRADAMVGWAKECGAQLFGHTLGWHAQQQTDFLSGLINRAADADAAAAAGFSDQFYFSRVFRKHRGVPPARFRAALRREIQNAHDPGTDQASAEFRQGRPEKKNS